MKRLLVTGGCGYLGSEFVRRAPGAGGLLRARLRGVYEVLSGP